MSSADKGQPPPSKLSSLRTATLPRAAADTGTPAETVDVKRLNRAASQAFLDAVLSHHDAHADQSVLLEKVRQRLEAAGVEPPSVEVRYHDVSVEVDTTVQQRFIPSIIKPLGRSFVNRGDADVDAGRRTRLTLLEKCSGVLRPGRLTLLLGPPGSGRTTFMRALAGRAQTQSDLIVSGDVTYNGRSLDTFQPGRAAAYVSQADLHYGELTVRETLTFAARCTGAEPMKELLEVLHEREAAAGITPDPAVDAFMKASAYTGSNTVDVERTLRLLGLEECSDTYVGNAMLRGISGGQKKRVTSGEALVGPARLLLGDEITTGLDSNTTFEVVKYLRGWVKALNATSVLALLQPAPETFELFDDVILLSAGMVVYNGPREGVLPFFSSLGFECPARTGVAEFLQEVTTATDQQKYWTYPGAKEYAYVTPAAMAERFEETEAAAASAAALAAPFMPPGGDDRLAAIPLPTAPYGASYGAMWKANAGRAEKLQSRRKLFLYVRVTQIVLMGFVTATLYIQVRDKETVDDGNLMMGAIFQSQIYMLLAGGAEMHVLGERLPVFFRQRESRMYPGSSFALPSFLWRLPYCAFDALLWSVIVYFSIGMDASAGRFFMYCLLMFLTAAWSTSLHQAVVAVVEETIATAVSMVVIMVLLVAGGYIIIKSAIPGAWKAAYYANPWFYLTQAFCVNEMTGSSWDTPYNATDPSSPTLGIAVLEFRDFETSYAWVWYGVAITIASIAVNVAVFVAAATWRPAPHRKGFITEDALAELQHNRGAAKALPASLRQDIELGMKRSASMAKIASMKGSTGNLVALAGSRPVSTTNLPALVNGNGNGAAVNGHANGHAAANGKPGELQSAGSGLASATSALPFEPLSLIFSDVGYSVPVTKNTRADDPRIAADGPHAGQLQLLHHVTGSFRPGVLTALMGASGAGKTTLMDVLAGRKTGGLITGDIRVNGHPKEHSTFSRISAYVEQEDAHLAECTVAEALEFSATLRLPTTVAPATRRAFVAEVMQLVELRRLSDAMVGHIGEGAGLTIEQRKRLTIAVEMVSNPSILFMDEPTTGLDARGAAVVMSVVRATAATGRTVVCTIHQPSYSIFEAFDELLVLKPGGRCIYNGPLGADAADLVGYLSAVPGVEAMPPQANPANWMLEQTAPQREKDLGVDFAEIYVASEVSKRALEVTGVAAVPPPGSAPLNMADMRTPSLGVQFRLIMGRFFTMYWRMPSYILTRFFVTVLVVAVFGSIFFDQGQAYLTDASPGGVLNISGVLFMSVLFVGATNGMTAQKVVADQRAVFYREKAAGMYPALPFAIAQGLVEWPYLIVQSIVYVFPLYYMIGFRSAAAPLGYFFIFFLLSIASFTEFGAFCVNVSPELGIAVLFFSFLFSFLNQFSGFMISSVAVGWWWRWAFYINPIAWTLYGLLASQLGDLDAPIEDFTGQIVPISEFMTDRFGYHYSMVGPIVAIMAGFVIAFRCISIYALTRMNFQNR